MRIFFPMQLSFFVNKNKEKILKTGLLSFYLKKKCPQQKKKIKYAPRTNDIFYVRIEFGNLLNVTYYKIIYEDYIM